MALQQELKRDLSPKAVKKAVLTSTVQKPLTVYGAAAVMLSTGFALMVEANVIALAALGVGAVVSAGTWAYEYFVRGNDHASEFVRAYRAELESRREAALKSLLKELESMEFERGMLQVDLFREKYLSFVEILDKKLNPSELTYNRYLSIAEQVFLGGLDNLENAALALKSVSAIDVERIHEELNIVGHVTHREELEKRLRLHEEQTEYADMLLLENERALTQLDHVSTKIARINTLQGRAQVDLEEAMAELRRLIDRAEDYSH